MREPVLVAEGVAAMIAACRIPVTVKCRLGVDDDAQYEVFLAFIDTVANAGCATFVVHARNAWLKGLSPKENRDVPPLRYDWTYQLKRDRPGLAVIVNGGIATLHAAATPCSTARVCSVAPRTRPVSLTDDVPVRGGCRLAHNFCAAEPYVELTGERCGAQTHTRMCSACPWATGFRGFRQVYEARTSPARTGR